MIQVLILILLTVAALGIGSVARLLNVQHALVACEAAATVAPHCKFTEAERDRLVDVVTTCTLALGACREASRP
jgi:hypothetical protein